MFRPHLFWNRRTGDDDELLERPFLNNETKLEQKSMPSVYVSMHVLDLRAAAETAAAAGVEQPPRRGVEWLAQNREPPCALCLKIHSVNTAGGISVLR